MGLRIQLKAPLELDHDLHRGHLTTWQLLWHLTIWSFNQIPHDRSYITQITYISTSFAKSSQLDVLNQFFFSKSIWIPVPAFLKKSSVPSLASVKRSSVYEELFYQAASFLHSLQNGRSVKLDHNLFRNQSFMSAKIHRDVNRRLRQRKSCLQRFTVICLRSRLARLFLVITQSLGFKNMQIGLTFIDGWLMFKDRVNANHFAMEVSL